MKCFLLLFGLIGFVSFSMEPKEQNVKPEDAKKIAYYMSRSALNLPNAKLFDPIALLKKAGELQTYNMEYDAPIMFTKCHLVVNHVFIEEHHEEVFKVCFPRDKYKAKDLFAANFTRDLTALACLEYATVHAEYKNPVYVNYLIIASISLSHSVIEMIQIWFRGLLKRPDYMNILQLMDEVTKFENEKSYVNLLAIQEYMKPLGRIIQDLDKLENIDQGVSMPIKLVQDRFGAVIALYSIINTFFRKHNVSLASKFVVSINESFFAHFFQDFYASLKANVDRFDCMSFQVLYELLECSQGQLSLVMKNQVPTHYFFKRIFLENVGFQKANPKLLERIKESLTMELEEILKQFPDERPAKLIRHQRHDDDNWSVEEKEEEENVVETGGLKPLPSVCDFVINEMDLYYGRFIIGEYIHEKLMVKILKEFNIDPESDFSWEFVLNMIETRLYILKDLGIPSMDFVSKCIEYIHLRNTIAHPDVDETKLFTYLQVLFRVLKSQNITSASDLFIRLGLVDDEGVFENIESLGRPKTLAPARIVEQSITVFHVYEFLKMNVLVPICDLIQGKPKAIGPNFVTINRSLPEVMSAGFKLPDVLFITKVLAPLRNSLAHPTVTSHQLKKYIETLFRDSEDYETFLKPLCQLNP